MYNATDGKVFVSLVECRWSGGLAQLGEHYVRNVGVGGSTPLPSTTFDASASRSPNDTQKNGATRSIVRNGEAHILTCQHLSCALVIPQNQTRQPREHGD